MTEQQIRDEQYHRKQRNAYLHKALALYDNRHNCRDHRGLVALYIQYAKAHHKRMLEARLPMAETIVYYPPPQDVCPKCGQLWDFHRTHTMLASATEPQEEIYICDASESDTYHPAGHHPNASRFTQEYTLSSEHDVPF